MYFLLVCKRQLKILHPNADCILRIQQWLCQQMMAGVWSRLTHPWIVTGKKLSFFYPVGPLQFSAYRETFALVLQTAWVLKRACWSMLCCWKGWLISLKSLLLHCDVEIISVEIWLAVSTPMKNMKVSWDDFSQYIWKNKIHVPNHQPEITV